MQEILSARQAARVIGCAPQKVRERMKRGIWTFGTVVTAKQTGNKKNDYEINARKFSSWLGISMEELEEKLEGRNRH